MKKIFKSLLSGVLSVVLLTSSVPFASANENYEQYLPVIQAFETNKYSGSIEFKNNSVKSEYKSGFSYCNFNSAYNYYSDENQISRHGIRIDQVEKSGVYPIKSIIKSNDNKILCERDTGYYIDITVLPPLETKNIGFIKTNNISNINGIEIYHAQANLGTDYPVGEYYMGNKYISSQSYVRNENDNLILDVYIARSEWEFRNFDDTINNDLIFQHIKYNGTSPDGKILYAEVTKSQHYDYENNTEPTPKPEPIPEYIYNETDTGEILTIPIVNNVTTETEALNKVQNAVNQATDEQKQSATGIDKLTLLAEEAAAKVNTIKLTDNNVNITSENIKENTALQDITNILTSANIQMQRTARNIVNYDLGDTETVNVKTENVSNKVDAVRVSTSYASATVNANTASDFTMTNKGEKTVEINFNKKIDTTITVSFPNMNKNDKYYAVVDENGNPVGGKYNPATGTLEAKLSESGIYKVVNNEKDFSDIKDKSAEMQEAIKVLASKGIINGTTAITFAPDSTISRAEVTALLMRTISLLDPNANGNFADVKTSNWYCGAAGSAKEHNIINGYEDNTFRGNAVIAKDQIIAVSARTLKQQMNYKTPSDVASELSVYADANSIASWAKEDVALATMTNLVLKRTDSTFYGTDGMTRGDAAIIMQRLFNKLW